MPLIPNTKKDLLRRINISHGNESDCLLRRPSLGGEVSKKTLRNFSNCLVFAVGFSLAERGGCELHPHPLECHTFTNSIGLLGNVLIKI